MLFSLKILDFSNCNHKGINYCVVQIGDLLSLHSSVNHEDFCLSYVFTYRDLGEGFIGKAWKASSNNGKFQTFFLLKGWSWKKILVLADEGGVCSHFVEGYNIQPDNFEDDSLMPKLERYTNASSKAISQSRNTGLVRVICNYCFWFQCTTMIFRKKVSLKYNGEMIPEYVSKLVFLHEIGHSLGSGVIRIFLQMVLNSQSNHFSTTPAKIVWILQRVILWWIPMDVCMASTTTNRGFQTGVSETFRLPWDL